jgi:hypothetical protein
MDSETLYIRIGQLIEVMPNLTNAGLTTEIHKWLGDAYALVEASGDLMSLVEFKTATYEFILHAGHSGVSTAKTQAAVRKIQAILYRALSVAELSAPTAIQGSFIPAGGAFDAVAVISKVLNKAHIDILIVDPYLDEKVLMDFAIATQENITIRLLADQNDHKASLKPAFQRWVAQYGNKRPLELRLAPHRMAHDRLIITDGSEVWVLTQSLNAFAARSPASVVRFPDPSIKIAAYCYMWQSATVVT